MSFTGRQVNEIADHDEAKGATLKYCTSALIAESRKSKCELRMRWHLGKGGEADT